MRLVVNPDESQPKENCVIYRFYFCEPKYGLAGGLELFFYFAIFLGIMIPIDEYFSEGLKPPTSFDIFVNENTEFVIFTCLFIGFKGVCLVNLC